MRLPLERWDMLTKHANPHDRGWANGDVRELVVFATQMEERAMCAEAQLADMPRHPAWTSAAPTEPGFYWHAYDQGNGLGMAAPFVVELTRDGSGELMVMLSHNELVPLEFYVRRGQWIGPLVAPAMMGRGGSDG